MSVRDGVLGARTRSRHRAERLAAVARPSGAPRRAPGLAVDAELVLEVDVGGGDEDVEVRPLGDPDRLDGPLRIAVAAASQGGDRDALRLAGDPLDRLEVAGRGGREAGLDDVDLEADELAGDLELLGGGQPGAGRLLPVAEGRVEDADASPAGRTARRAGVRRCSSRRPGVVAAAWAWPARPRPDRGTPSGSRSSAADLLDLVVAVGLRAAARTRRGPCRSRRSSGAAKCRPGCRQDGPHRLADVLVDDPRPADT